MKAEWYKNEIKNNRDYESVYELVNEMADDKDVSNEEFDEIYNNYAQILWEVK